MRTNIAMSYATELLCVFAMTLGASACRADTEDSTSDQHVDSVHQQVKVCMEPSECGSGNIWCTIPDESSSWTCYCDIGDIIVVVCYRVDHVLI